MTRNREVQKAMTKFGLEILMLLKCEDIVVPSKALSISEILEKIPTQKRKSYSTTYRHLQNMTEQGYIKCGLTDGLASTYFITEPGKAYCKAQSI